MIHLASKSPQRRALLEALAVDFDVILPEYREDDLTGEDPATMVERHSRGKAESVLSRVKPLGSSDAVLGVDTMVVLEGRALGKAADEAEALEFLHHLSGNIHEVYSGLTLLVGGGGSGGRQGQPEAKQPGGPRRLTGHCVTQVRFSRVTEDELQTYIALGEWRQRAGAYAIQGRASAFVEEITGDYTNVVGLPVPLLVSFLRESGLWPPDSWRGA